MVVIRDAAPADELAWRQLWAGYVEFYETQVAEIVTASTWARGLDPESGVLIRIATIEDLAVGFTASVLHPGTWALEPVCYLEDLFVDHTARRRGVGSRLIQDLIDQGKARGWARLYWHTRAGNAAARDIYDKFCGADDFVRYRMAL